MFSLYFLIGPILNYPCIIQLTEYFISEDSKNVYHYIVDSDKSYDKFAALLEKLYPTTKYRRGYGANKDPQNPLSLSLICRGVYPEDYCGSVGIRYIEPEVLE